MGLYAIVRKAQSSQWKSPGSPPQPKKACWSNIKAMLTSFNYEDVVHNVYAPPVQTVTKLYYSEILHRLRGAVRIKWK